MSLMTGTFGELIVEFNNLIAGNPPADKIKNKLLELKSKATVAAGLNNRQIDSIYSRCENYLSGNWGKNGAPKGYKAHKGFAAENK